MGQAAKLIICGRVQGIGLRYAVSQYARQKRLAGWIKNEADGTVSCLVQAPEKEVGQLIGWLKKSNDLPGIEQIKTIWSNQEETLTNFRIIH